MGDFFNIWQGWKESNFQHSVLETDVLPLNYIPK